MSSTDVNGFTSTSRFCVYAGQREVWATLGVKGSQVQILSSRRSFHSLGGEDRYTPFGYANPTRRVLATVLLTRARIQAPEPTPADADIDPQTHDHPTARLGYTVDVVELVDRYGYRPLVKPLRALATLATRLQSGRLDAYLTYMLIALIALIAVATALS